MFADLISADDPRWSRALERIPHDVYHRPEYARFAARHEGGVAAAFLAQGEGRQMLIPLLLKPLPPQLGAPDAWQDATSAYGYPGPIASHPDDDGWLQACRTKLYELASAHGIVAAFVRLHPLHGIPAERLRSYGAIVEHGPIVYLELTKDPAVLAAEMRKNHRRDIQRLAQAGFTASVDDWGAYPSFASLYRATMDRVAAQRFYYFSDEYFADLERMLQGHLHICAVRAPDGQLAAAGLFFETDGLIQYHLGGTTPAHLPQSPSKLMFGAVAGWGRSIGARLMHLGGGTGGHCDSLYQFKSGFSRSRALFHTLRMVFNEHAYSRLAQAWRDGSSGEEAAADYFPIYRQPSSAPYGEVKACTT